MSGASGLSGASAVSGASRSSVESASASHESGGTGALPVALLMPLPALHLPPEVPDPDSDDDSLSPSYASVHSLQLL